MIMVIRTTYVLFYLLSPLLQLEVMRCFACLSPFMLKANSMSTRLASTHPFSKGTHNQKCVLSSEIKAQVSRSVGLIYVDKMPAGTGFRVGEMYIVTCAHVIENVFQCKSCL